MKLYLELYFSSEGTKPNVVIKKMKNIGFEPVVGEYDFVQEYDSPEEYAEIVDELNEVLKGSDVRYRLITRND